MALSHLGVSKAIANIETERSAEATACRAFFDHVIEEVMRDFNYPFATKYATLALVASDPNDEWGYSYRYPEDCARLLKILSGARNDSRQSRVAYQISKDTSGKLIFTDEASAKIKYTTIITDVSIFTADTVSAISFLLAAFIAPRVTAGDPFKLGERAYQLYLLAKDKSEINALNEQQDEENVESQFIRDRE